MVILNYNDYTRTVHSWNNTNNPDTVKCIKDIVGNKQFFAYKL